ncbi:MAG TPA: glycosyltransferase [Candidatus Gracilibacteria bacterium]
MKFSIIIPTIGRETLTQVLEGITQCTDYKSIDPEVLVVWDGEAKYQISDIRYQKVKVLETGTKVYAGGARNLGLEYARGDIVIFISDDTIPTKSWLQKIYKFHVLNPQKEKALLGKINWTSELQKDSFHRWLLDHGQFNFKELGVRSMGQGESFHAPYLIPHTPYRYFYTSNISVKRALIEDERFDLQFEGWGFEDGEFGYRLQKKGMKLYYDQSCKVSHDHRLTLEDLKKNTTNAKKNAEIFEKLHPEIKIRPRGLKRWILLLVIWFFQPFGVLNRKLAWWCEWKKAWV